MTIEQVVLILEHDVSTQLDDRLEVAECVYVHDFESQHVRFALCAGVPDHVTLEIISLLRRQLAECFVSAVTTVLVSITYKQIGLTFRV